MKIISGLVQGSDSWHQHRANHFNASDAPAMLGLSKYKTRSQLLHELHTGSAPEVDAGTQQRFNDGHRFEALARPLAEEIIGDELSPVVGTEGKLSASFDGITFGGDVIFEHKTLNDKIRDAFASNVIPAENCAQMEQQLMVSGATKCLFMASKFDGNDALVEELHCWYESDQVMRDNIVQGWTQFAIDLEEYKRKLAAGEIEAHKEKPKAEAIMDLPALSVQATGMVTYSNLPEFKAAAENYIANINTDLQTDQQFADAEATVKFCKSTEEKLEVTKAAILAQTATIDEVIRTVSYIQEQLSNKRLVLDKLVKSEKEARKASILQKTKDAYAIHTGGLYEEIKPIILQIPYPDFAGAMKGLKSLASMQDALDTALANAKIAADAAAKDIRAKMLWIATNAEGMAFLFPDLQQIIVKPLDDFTLLIQSRIKDHKEAEAKKEAEMRAKAESEAAAKIVTATPAIGGQHQESGAVTPSNIVVIEHQAEISAFLASRDFGKDSGKVRAILVEFVKFSAQYGSGKKAA